MASLMKRFGPDVGSPMIHRRLLWAARRGDLDQVQQLVALGLTGVLSSCDIGGILSTLHMASQANHFEIVRYFLDEFREALSENDAADQDSTAATLLLFAVRSNHLTMVQYFVQVKGVRVNQADQNGWTPLHHASMHNHRDMVQYLVEQGGADIDATDTDGWTALHCASLYNRLEIVEYLVATSPSTVHTCTLAQQTSLHVAAGALHVEMVRFLIVYGGANVMAKDHEGHMAVHLATNRCRTPPCGRVEATIWCLVQHLPVDHGVSHLYDRVWV